MDKELIYKKGLIDLDVSEDITKKLLGNIRILDFLTSNCIESLNVTVANDIGEEFNFSLYNGMLEQALHGLKRQLRDRVKELQDDFVKNYSTKSNKDGTDV